MGTTTGGFTIYYYTTASNQIQNGSPDGIALSGSGGLIQFISYEGIFTASDGPAVGVASIDIGVEQNNTDVNSLQLSGTGSSYAAFTWSVETVRTSGAVNTGQTFGTPVDTDPPGWTSGYPKAGTILDTKGSVVVNLSEPGTVYYIVVYDGATPPTSAQVKAAVDYDTVHILPSGSIAVTEALVDYTEWIAGASPGASYDIYLVAEDDEATPNLQTGPVLLDVTMTEARSITITSPVARESFYLGGTAPISWTSQNVAQIVIGGWDYEENAYFIFLEDDHGDPVPIDASLGTMVFPIPLSVPFDSLDIAIWDAIDMELFDQAGPVYLIDTIAPKVEAVAPANGSSDAPAMTALTIAFTEKVFIGTGSFYLRLADGTLVESFDVTAVDSIDAGEVTALSFKPSQPLVPGTSYYVEADAGIVADRHGIEFRGISGADTWAFIDVIGIPTMDPGTGWPVAGVPNATAEHTLLRKATVSMGNTDWLASAGTDPDNSEWKVYDQNFSANLGMPTPTASDQTDIEDIVLFSAGEDVTIETSVNKATGTVAAEVLFGTDVTALTPTIGISLGAGISPASGVAQDFTNPVVYTITAQDGSTQEWTVSVTPQVPVEASIYEIQYTTDPSGNSPLETQLVKTNGIVTAIDNIGTTKGFWIQDSSKMWNGMFVYVTAITVSLADSVSVIGEVKEYYNLTELSYVKDVTVIAGGKTIPAPVTILPGEMLEPYEGVLVKLLDVICTIPDAGFGMFKLSDGTDEVLADDDMYKHTPTLDQRMNLTGIGHYSFDEWKVMPRSSADVTVLAPNAAPVIGAVTLNPATPLTTSPVVLTVPITDELTLADDSVRLYYGITQGTYPNEVTIARTTGDNFSGTIPAQAAGTVFCRITAADADKYQPLVAELTGQYTVVTTGIGETSLFLGISLYPNPGEGWFRLEMANNTGQTARIEVLTLHGQLVEARDVHGQFVREEFTLSQPGIYLLKIQAGDQIAVRKLVSK